MNLKEIKEDIERTIVRITSNINSFSETRENLIKEINNIDSNIDNLNATLQHLMYLKDMLNHINQNTEKEGTSTPTNTHLKRLREMNSVESSGEKKPNNKKDSTKIEFTVGDLAEALYDVFTDLFE